MAELTLKLEPREITGKKVASLRQDGLVPSVVYGGSAQAIATQSPIVVTTKIVTSAGRHTPVRLSLDGKKKLAIIKTIDVNPVKHTLLHVAFQTIKQNELITTEVPIHLIGIGESQAERAGLVILQAIEQVEIKAKPADLPEALEIPIADLATTDDKLTLNDIVLPEGVEFDDPELDRDLVIANVYEPSALAAANEAAGGTAESEEEATEETSEEATEPEAGEKSDSGDKEKTNSEAKDSKESKD